MKFAPISMFGLRWINATSLRWHTTPECPALVTARKNAGWTAFPITLGYGRNTYTPCGRCVAPEAQDQQPGGDHA